MMIGILRWLTESPGTYPGGLNYDLSLSLFALDSQTNGATR